MVTLPGNDSQLLSTFGITLEERALATVGFCFIPISQCLIDPRLQDTPPFDLKLSVGIKAYHVIISLVSHRFKTTAPSYLFVLYTRGRLGVSRLTIDA